MHIKIEDQDTGDTSVLCIDREAKTAEILALVPGHTNTLIQLAQSVGAVRLAMIADATYGSKALQPHGFRVATNLSVYVKEF